MGSAASWRCPGRHRRHLRDEEGFTLVELLIVIVILPLIMGAVAVVMITSFEDQTGLQNRLADSSDSQITSAFYVRDVQSAVDVTTRGASSLSPAPCLPGPSNGTFLIGLFWPGTGGDTVVSYWDAPVPGSTTATELVRQICVNGSTTPSSMIVSHDVSSPSSLPTITVSCASTESGCATSAASNWESTAGVSAVTLSAAEPGSGYHYSLLATPRLWTPASGGAPSGGQPPASGAPPLLLLGPSAPALTCSGNGSVDVTGEVALDPTANGAATLAGNARLSASGGIYSADTQSNPQPISTSGNASYSPATITYGSPIADPYANLTPPTSSPSYGGASYGGNTVATMQPGTYTGQVTVSGNAQVTLASGIYVLEQGISVTGNAGLQSATGGVLLYVTGGQTDIAGNGGVSLDPIGSPPSPVTGLVIWQDKSDTDAVTLDGNASGNLYGGTIYAPTAEVGGAGNAGFTAGSVIASSLSCDGNASTTVTG